jgi:hypothetical protein
MLFSHSDQKAQPWEPKGRHFGGLWADRQRGCGGRAPAYYYFNLVALRIPWLRVLVFGLPGQVFHIDIPSISRGGTDRHLSVEGGYPQTPVKTLFGFELFWAI